MKKGKIEFIGWFRYLRGFRIGIELSSGNTFHNNLYLYFGLWYAYFNVYKKKGIHDEDDWIDRFMKDHCWKEENPPESSLCDKCGNHTDIPIDYITEDEKEFPASLFVKCLVASKEAGFPVMTCKSGCCDLFKGHK
jgi:hypothetical protein